MKVRYAQHVAAVLDDHRGCKVRTDRIYNNDTPAIGIECMRHGLLMEFALPVQVKAVKVVATVRCWWPEEMPDSEDVARGIWEALPAEWTDPNIGDEFWISDINPMMGS